jgi:predicted esterase
LRTREYLYGLIDEEIKAGTPSERIILGGFSQGAAMSLFAGTTYKHKLGGIIGLSGFLPCNDKIEGLIPEGNANKDTPILMCHGDQDPVVLPTWGRMSAEFLKKGGWKVDYKEYRGLVHSASPQEIDDVATFLQGRIPDQK